MWDYFNVTLKFIYEIKSKMLQNGIRAYPALDGGSMQAYEGVTSAMLWNAKSGLPHEG